MQTPDGPAVRRHAEPNAALDHALAARLIADGRVLPPETPQWEAELLAVMATARARLESHSSAYLLGDSYVSLVLVTREDIEGLEREARLTRLGSELPDHIDARHTLGAHPPAPETIPPKWRRPSGGESTQQTAANDSPFAVEVSVRVEGTGSGQPRVEVNQPGAPSPTLPPGPPQPPPPSRPHRPHRTPPVEVVGTPWIEPVGSPPVEVVGGAVAAAAHHDQHDEGADHVDDADEQRPRHVRVIAAVGVIALGIGFAAGAATRMNSDPDDEVPLAKASVSIPTGPDLTDPDDGSAADYPSESVEPLRLIKRRPEDAARRPSDEMPVPATQPQPSPPGQNGAAPQLHPRPPHLGRRAIPNPLPGLGPIPLP
ncbi:MAG: hypothetical protein QM728_13500 [Gordonia sp. (in: high G+C Gram-positive bacteria)]|uniref:hypothetical protein n=1 Tax=Gordonia sp. (in: high G+C Gram-positive bacteria) TaxID=84139 RepID=UPI0039E3F312